MSLRVHFEERRRGSFYRMLAILTVGGTQYEYFTMIDALAAVRALKEVSDEERGTAETAIKGSKVWYSETQRYPPPEWYSPSPRYEFGAA